MLIEDDVPGAIAQLAPAGPAALACGMLTRAAVAFTYLSRAEYAAGEWDDASVHAAGVNKSGPRTSATRWMAIISIRYRGMKTVSCCFATSMALSLSSRCGRRRSASGGAAGVRI